MNLSYNRQSTYGHNPDLWLKLKQRARAAIVSELIEHGRLITYAKLRDRLEDLAKFGTLEPAYHHLLAQISEDEDDAGRGLLGAAVVLKKTNRPGQGWFDIARRRGRKMDDLERCWLDELIFLIRSWTLRNALGKLDAPPEKRVAKKLEKRPEHKHVAARHAKRVVKTHAAAADVPAPASPETSPGVEEHLEEHAVAAAAGAPES